MSREEHVSSNSRSPAETFKVIVFDLLIDLPRIRDEIETWRAMRCNIIPDAVTDVIFDDQAAARKSEASRPIVF